MDKNSSLKSFLGMVLFGSLFMVVGAVIVLLSLDVIPSSDANFNAPRWVVAFAGAFFMVAGTMPMIQGLKQFVGDDHPLLQLINNLVMLGFLLLFAVPFNWVAFGSGEREFSSSTSVGGLAVSFANIGQLSGRCVFGVFAVFLDLLIIYSVIRFLRGDDLVRSNKK